MIPRRSAFGLIFALTSILIIVWWQEPARETAPPPDEPLHRLHSKPKASPAAGEPQTQPEAAASPTYERAEAGESERHASPVNGHSHVIQSREGFAELPIHRLGQDFIEGRRDSFRLPLFEDDDPDEVVVQIQHYQENPRFGGGVLRGTVPGYEGSLVSVAQVGDSIAGSIHIPTLNKIYEVRPGPGGTTLFSAIDARELGECLLCQDADNARPAPAPPQAIPVPLP
jgi:hypothetical protein